MTANYTIQIVDDLLMLLDNEGNGCDGHVLQNLRAANRQLCQWYKEYKFNFAAARQEVVEFFRNRPADHPDEAIERIAGDVLQIASLTNPAQDDIQLSIKRIAFALRAAYEAGRTSLK